MTPKKQTTTTLIVTDPHNPNDVASNHPDYIPLHETYGQWRVRKQNEADKLEKKLKSEMLAKKHDPEALKKLQEKEKTKQK